MTPKQYIEWLLYSQIHIGKVKSLLRVVPGAALVAASEHQNQERVAINQDGDSQQTKVPHYC